MIGISLWRVIQSALKNFWRNIWLSVATTVIMTITLLMIAFLYFMSILGNQVLVSIEDKVDLLVTFKPNVQEQYINAVADEIRTRDDVKNVTVTTSDQALAAFHEQHKDDPLIEESIKQLGDNPLPASLSVIATEPRFYENIAKQLESEKYTPYIEKVHFDNSKLVIDRLISVMSSIKNGGLVVAVTFAVLVVLIMFNTIRLAIYSFREEIDIMRLVGASRWFIQGPFIIEAMFVAFVAVILSTIIIYPSLKAVAPELQRFFFDTHDTPFNIYDYAVSHWLAILGLQVAISMGLAIISSWIAVRRYLRD